MTSDKRDWLIESAISGIVKMAMEDTGAPMADALSAFASSPLFEALSDKETGLYLESPSYLYELYRDYRKGRVCIMHESNPYLLDRDEHGAVAITKKNCDFVEAILGIDSAYSAAEQGESGSSGCFLQEKKDAIFESRKALRCYIKKINGENSTRLSVKTDIEHMTDAIHAIMADRDAFLDRVRSGDPSLVDQIARDCKSLYARDETPRNNFSFASKFCAYFARSFFDDPVEQDAFSAYDSFAAGVLPYYIWAYDAAEDLRSYIGRSDSRIPQLVRNELNYGLYKELIDSVREASATVTWQATRRELDHLLWYCHKGRSGDIRELVGIVVRECGR